MVHDQLQIPIGSGGSRDSVCLLGQAQNLSYRAVKRSYDPAASLATSREWPGHHEPCPGVRFLPGSDRYVPIIA